MVSWGILTHRCPRMLNVCNMHSCISWKVRLLETIVGAWMPSTNSNKLHFRAKDCHGMVFLLSSFSYFLFPVLLSRMKSELFLYNKLFLPELCHMSLLCLCAAVSVILLSGKIRVGKTHSHSSLRFQSVQSIYIVKNVSLHVIAEFTSAKCCEGQIKEQHFPLEPRGGTAAVQMALLTARGILSRGDSAGENPLFFFSCS